MKWKEITDLKELTSCIWCDSIITSDLFISQTDRRKLECNNCGCIMYENRGKLWYVVPDKESIKQVELSNYL